MDTAVRNSNHHMAIAIGSDAARTLTLPSLWGFSSTSRRKERLLRASPPFNLREWLVPPIPVPVVPGLLIAAAIIVRWQLRSNGDAHHVAPAVAFETSFHADPIIAVNTKGMTMKKPLLSIEEPEPKKKAVRADRPPTEGFATIVDGHFKSEFDTAEAAEVSGRKLKTAYPMLQVQVYDAAMKVRTLLS
jgi:hypothetical protein